MESKLDSLKIDRTKRRVPRSRSAKPVAAAVTAVVALGAAGFVLARRDTALEVRTVRVAAPVSDGGGATVLNATGYVVPAHRVELASKVDGRVAWIGVEKGDRVAAGEALVRLEDVEFRTHVTEAEGDLGAARARLAEAENGSRPEEVARARADVDAERAELANAETSLARTRSLAASGVVSRQALDDAESRYRSQSARVASLERSGDLVRLGPRREEIDVRRAEVTRAEGALAFAKSQLENTVIRAASAGVVLERNVEVGEFVTTGFVGDRGAKGYVVALADLDDLRVELDVNQSDFAKLAPRQPAAITTDAYPDRSYAGELAEVAPEANRQKATVQVKVRVTNPDELLRPEMNASVAFRTPASASGEAAAPEPIVVPATAVRDGAVFVVVDGKVERRPVRAGATTSRGVEIADGLAGGEEVVAAPAADLAGGRRVRSIPEEGATWKR